MLEQLLNHINRQALCKTSDKILLAVSGGVDSIVMLHLFREAGFRIGAAHCNFQLRAADSDGDEEFVRDICRQFDIPVFSTRFETDSHAASRGISLQMAAKDLRYEFFNNVVKGHGFDYVATAHHVNDNIESVLLNIIRGTGIDGLRGIAPKKQNIIRPMLFATRKMIMDYALQKALTWREDASNATDDYQRNFLRHQIIPKIQEMNPGFEEGFAQTHERLLGARAFAHAYILDVKEAAVHDTDENSMAIDIRKIRETQFPAVLLWEIIKEKGFKYDQCQRIVMDHQPGKIFLSESYQLLVDRTQYIVDRKRSTDFVSQYIEEGQRLASNGALTLVLSEISRSNFTLGNDSAIAQLDADRLTFPLLWRKWRAGDYFIPLGMRAEKKLSDFLIDLKMPFNAKADITILESGGEIVWIVDHRINDRYKITAETKKILVVEARQRVGEKIIS